MEKRKVAQRFEDLFVWQKARVLTNEVFRLTSSSTMSRHRRFCEQLEGASISIMNNIAEGFDRSGRADFSRFLLIAKASCGEVRSIAYVALDRNFVDQTDHQLLLDQTDEVSRLIRGLRASLDRKQLDQSVQSTASNSVSTASDNDSRISELGARNSGLRDA